LLELCAKLVQILTNATKCRTPAHSSASTASAHTYANVPRAMSKRQTIERARSATVSLCSPCFFTVPVFRARSQRFFQRCYLTYLSCDRFYYTRRRITPNRERLLVKKVPVILQGLYW